jgi:two-component system, cell cycle sensor histidine kinase and response regulator CckA
MEKRILVVEDDESVRAFSVAALKFEGYDVLTASSVSEARRIISDQPPATALCLIIDVVLEDESGIHFAQELIQAHPNFRILLISGFTEDVVMTAPEDVARIGFLPKPFSRAEFAAAVDRVCS